jgi:hypothetical protein
MKRDELIRLSALERATDALTARGGGAAVVVWLEDGEPCVIATNGAKFAIAAGRYLQTTQPTDPPPATPRTHGRPDDWGGR